MKFVSFLKRPTILILFVVFVIGIIVTIVAIRNNSNNNSEIFIVQKTTLVQEVSVSGKTKPVQSTNLSFKDGGKVYRVLVNIGDTVVTGTLVAQLDTNELNAQLAQKNAALLAATAKRDELAVEVMHAYQSASPILQEAFIKADDAVNQKTDDLFINDNTNPQLSFTTLDSQARIDAVAGRALMNETLAQWRALTQSINFSSNETTLEAALAKTKQFLNSVEQFLQRAFDAVNFSADLTNTSKSSYQANLTTARTNINTVFDKINTQSQTIALQKAKLNSQEAHIKQLEADIALVNAQLNNALLRSPINGVVTRVNIDPGEVAGPNETIVSIISENNLEVETDVPELDIAKIKVGNPTRITFDAIENETFDGVVTSIEPAETIIDGVVNFKVKVNIIKSDMRIKSGLTANLTIETAKKENILAIPSIAITTNADGVFVQKIENKNTISIPVRIGFRGQNGMVELISGLSEGDIIVLSI